MLLGYSSETVNHKQDRCRNVLTELGSSDEDDDWDTEEVATLGGNQADEAVRSSIRMGRFLTNLFC